MSSLETVQQGLSCLSPNAPAIDQLRSLVAQGLDELPLPGSGSTIERWRVLASVAAHDLSLAKLYEGHTDALAILAELGVAALRPTGSVWATWASESPAGRATLQPAPGGHGVVHGAKVWCSGADGVSHGLMTSWLEDGSGPQLVSLEMAQAGIEIDASRWQAVGMAASASLQLRLSGAHVSRVGKAGDYLARPGFWHGGAGVAACWYGGALALAQSLQHAVSAQPDAQRNPFRLAALGKVDVLLQQTASVLREAARWIDDHPAADAQAVAMRARLSAEACASAVLDAVGKALGAGPYCQDARFARRAADLPVFIRQSHAERDQAALGARIAASGAATWAL